MSIVIDIAWDRPSVAQIQATGAVGVMRYFSTDSTKNLTRSEVTEYHAAGLGVGDVWETSTGRATQGYAAGVADARAADAQRMADGLPADQAIYLAVDEDTSWASVQPYFDGAASVLGVDGRGIPRTGVYGGYQVIEGAYQHGLRRLWQTLAWSNGQRSQHACLFQNGSTALSGQADINDVLAPDWGQYPHPEADMPLTTADATLVAETLLNTRMPAFAGIPRAGEAPYVPTVAEVLNGAKTADTALAAVKAELDAVKTQLASATAPTLTTAQVQALAAQLAPVLVPQLVAALGHALDGTKP